MVEMFKEVHHVQFTSDAHGDHQTRSDSCTVSCSNFKLGNVKGMLRENGWRKKQCTFPKGQPLRDHNTPGDFLVASGHRIDLHIRQKSQEVWGLIVRRPVSVGFLPLGKSKNNS